MMLPGAILMFDTHTMRRRFHDLTKQAADIRVKGDPLRAERDALLASVAGRVAELEKQIKAIEAPLYDLEQERALIARALGGKTGSPE